MQEISVPMVLMVASNRLLHKQAREIDLLPGIGEVLQGWEQN